MDVWSDEESQNQKRTRERISKSGPVTKNISEKEVKRYTKDIKRRDEGHMPRRISDVPVPGKRRR